MIKNDLHFQGQRVSRLLGLSLPCTGQLRLSFLPSWLVSTNGLLFSQKKELELEHFFFATTTTTTTTIVGVNFAADADADADADLFTKNCDIKLLMDFFGIIDPPL